MASRKAGITEVPALVVSLDRDAAAIVLVDSNPHREHILPSEKAFAYKLKAEALEHQGWRSDLTSCQVGTKLRTDEQITADTNESARQIQRYIRLTNLIPEILQYVDDGRIAFTPAVELSYLYVKVDVYFTAAGMIDIPTEEEILAMMAEIRENPQEFRFVA